jgi:polyhydroxyalkanoate synthase
MAQSSQGNAAELLQEYTRLFETMMTACFTPGNESAASKNAKAQEHACVDVEKLLQTQLNYLNKQSQLWQAVSQAMLDEQKTAEPVVVEAPDDRRFSDSEWQENPFYSFIKQSYLLNSNLLCETLDSMRFEEPAQREQLKFFTRQYINALSPTNTLLGNPEVYRKTLDSQGQNLQSGFQNLLRDWQQSPQQGLKITQTDESVFKVGENLATTPGKVVYQNEIMQLIQYEPATEKVFSRPILITPPYINKFYVLDLDEKKSLVRWLVNQGFTVFMISWVNPDARLAHKNFGDYVMQGPVEALNVVRSITRVEKTHLIGYCVGGTLASIAAALLKEQGRDCLASLTLLTTLLDFSKPGEVGHYLSEASWPLLREQVQAQGYMDGRTLAMGFSLLRENQLFWPYFINNYLKGEEPQPFDILYWNSDSTHIPAANYVEYIESTYLKNLLREPGAFSVNGTPIDLGVIDVPVYFLATQTDHIVLWDAAYRSSQLISAPSRFVLAGSGHLAGVINPENSGKYGFWTNAGKPETAAEWFEGAEQQQDSWWPDWFAWARAESGRLVNAREVGNKPGFPALEDAPGNYVRRRI